MAVTYRQSVGTESVCEIDASTTDETVVLPAGFAAGRRFTVRRVDSVSGNVATVQVPNGCTLNGALNGTIEVSTNVEGYAVLANPGVWETYGLTTAPNIIGTGPDSVSLLGAPYPVTSNSSSAFEAAMIVAKNARRTMPFALDSDAVGTTVINIPAGTWIISDINGLLGSEGMNIKASGLRFRGQGLGITTVIFKPATAGALCTNDYWQFLEFEEITFTAATPGCTFMHSATSNAAQNYRFSNCAWNKWNTIFYLEGDNNNSEYCFINCSSSGIETSGAWLRIPTTGSDQNLNYWWFGGSHQSTSAPLVDAYKGGHFKVYGFDCSGWGGALTSPGYIFNLRGTTHNLGVCTIVVDGLRVEGGSANAGLLYSEWPHGTVAFRSIDWSSQVDNYTFGNDFIKVAYADDGPLYSFRDSILAGGLKVTFGNNSWSHRHKIVVENCAWAQKTGPSDVVVYDSSSASPNVTSYPPVEFIGCRNYGTYGNALDPAGVVVWDAIIGYRGDMVQSLIERCVSVRSLHGLPINGETVTAILPVGSIITKVEAFSPAGSVTEADGGSWVVATTDTSPVTVAAVTVTGAMSAGFAVTTTLTPPFQCSTFAKAKLTVTASGVTESNNQGILLIRGYW